MLLLRAFLIWLIIIGVEKDDQNADRIASSLKSGYLHAIPAERKSST
jgi:hypothetical protein